MLVKNTNIDGVSSFISDAIMEAQLVEKFMLNSDDILNKRVSFQINAWSSLSKEITISEVLNEIKSDKHKQQVSNLRALLKFGNKEAYNSHKKNLPAVTFCGSFEGSRKKENLKSYNSIIVLDIDKLNGDEFCRVKECLLNDSIVFSYWESPSQEGIKGLVLLKFSFEVNDSNIDRTHKIGFDKLATYFKETHQFELDNSGSDTSRLCFFSYDSSLCLKKEIIAFEITEKDYLELSDSKVKSKRIISTHLSNRDALFNPKDRNYPNDRYTIQAIIKFLKRKNLSITHSYEEWYKVAMAISNSFTIDIGAKYFIQLSSLDKQKFDEANCKSFLNNCYETRNGTIKFNTIVYSANKKGYMTKKQRERGSEAADENLSHVSSS